MTVTSLPAGDWGLGEWAAAVGIVGVAITALGFLYQFLRDRRDGERTAAHHRTIEGHAAAQTTQLARVADAVVQATHALPPAPAGEPDLPIFEVPHPRNPHFRGRDAILDEIRAGLTSGGEVAIAQTRAIHGLGGVGKTQVALEYTYRHGAEYDLVWWVAAETPASLTSQYSALAGPLKLPERDATDQRAVVAAVRRWLERHGRWLLVFDNAETLEEVEPFVPRRGAGHVLLTSRSPEWDDVAKLVRLDVMEPDEARDFLLERTGSTDKDAAAALAEELGRLPLALEQAGAYIHACALGIPAYLDLYRTRRPEVEKDQRAPHGYKETVATTWLVSMEAAERESPIARGLLNLFAFLAPDDIPEALFVEHAAHLPEPLRAGVGDPLQLNKARGALLRFSLVEYGDGLYSVHRLVQQVVRDGLPEAESKRWAEAAVRVVNAGFPYDSHDVRFWPACAPLLTHATVSATHAEDYQVGLDAAARLLNQSGLYLKARAEYAEAKPLFERALRIDEAAYGPDHPNVARDVNNLGRVLRDLGDLPGAKVHFERVVEIFERLEHQHPNLGGAYNNLGSVLQDLGDLPGAKAHYERALRIDEAAYGPDHPEVARDVNNLGGVLRALGDLPGAKARFERALRIDEAAYGPDHPEVATDVNNLGLVLRALGDRSGAKKHYERALRIDEAAYGPNHPTVAIHVNNLGDVLQALGDLLGAKAHYERALRIGEAAYGPDHPMVATLVNNLGDVLRALVDLPGAKARFERALRIFEEFLGPDHPKTQIVRRNLESLPK